MSRKYHVLVAIVLGLLVLAMFTAEIRGGLDDRIKKQKALRMDVREAIAEFELAPEGNTIARDVLRNKACDLIDRLHTSYREDAIVRFDVKECK